ncbi:Monofunctional biosynthetic peptidoglycan transglycosylase [Caballeronia sordidicola]|uniref:Monofunctional biosynthetic peptidoglycan transglycosylase n=1 Tax=Caballeronia sordidicola TaxID=196367 RepID=A0A242MYH2_CABSO|nr:Monofunctional biosynthetic peptidoglycan transglycosylase [Caballeronia sordidicola]
MRRRLVRPRHARLRHDVQRAADCLHAPRRNPGRAFVGWTRDARGTGGGIVFPVARGASGQRRGAAGVAAGVIEVNLKRLAFSTEQAR